MLSGKTAIITGGTSNIGRHFSLELARQNFAVFLHYHQAQEEAENLAAKIEKMGGQCFLHQADLGSDKELNNLADKISNLENPTLLINNASIFTPSNLPDSSFDEYEKNFAIHLKAPMILTKAFAQNCSDKKLPGNVVNMLDKNITRYQTKYFYYNLSKKSLADFTKMAALQLAPKIRVNGLGIGFYGNKCEGDDYMARFIPKIPLERKVEIENIISGLNYLLQNDCVSGDILFIDGGSALNHA